MASSPLESDATVKRDFPRVNICAAPLTATKFLVKVRDGCVQTLGELDLQRPVEQGLGPHVGSPSAVEIVDADQLVAFDRRGLAKMRAEKSRAACGYGRKLSPCAGIRGRRGSICIVVQITPQSLFRFARLGRGASQQAGARMHAER
jgi:hypothetical protein